MFFFFGGISPRIKRVTEPSRRMLDLLRKQSTGFCANCQTNVSLDVFRQDYWLNVFFLPLARMKEGEEYLGCDECEMPIIIRLRDTCRSCNGPLMAGMRFCPNCGIKL